MANELKSTSNYEYAVVDAAPAVGAGGYWTNPVHIKTKGKPVYFSIRETDEGSTDSVVSVTLQFKCPGDTTWQKVLNNGSEFAIGDRVQIHDLAANVLYRAGVADDTDYTSGSITFGFDW